jgi:hypothetical protein
MDIDPLAFQNEIEKIKKKLTDNTIDQTDLRNRLNKLLDLINNYNNENKLELAKKETDYKNQILQMINNSERKMKEHLSVHFDNRYKAHDIDNFKKEIELLKSQMKRASDNIIDIKDKLKYHSLEISDIMRRLKNEINENENQTLHIDQLIAGLTNLQEKFKNKSVEDQQHFQEIENILTNLKIKNNKLEEENILFKSKLNESLIEENEINNKQNEQIERINNQLKENFDNHSIEINTISQRLEETNEINQNYNKQLDELLSKLAADFSLFKNEIYNENLLNQSNLNEELISGNYFLIIQVKKIILKFYFNNIIDLNESKITQIQQYNEIKNVNESNANQLNDLKNKLKYGFSEIQEENQNKIEQLRSNLHSEISSSKDQIMGGKYFFFNFKSQLNLALNYIKI